MGKENTGGIGCLGLGLIIFGLAAIKPLFGLIVGTDVTKMQSINRETGDITNDLDSLKAGFVVFLISLIFYGYGKFQEAKDKEKIKEGADDELWWRKENLAKEMSRSRAVKLKKREVEIERLNKERILKNEMDMEVENYYKEKMLMEEDDRGES